MARIVVLVNVLLGGFKLGVGWVAGSAGVTADGVQSLTAAGAAILVAAAMQVGKRPPDRMFPYGYAKVELLASIISLSFLFGVGLVMFISSALLLRGEHDRPGALAIPVAAVSIGVTWLVYRACDCAGVRTRSAAMLSNAKQSRADLFSSSAVLAGVSLSQFDGRLALLDTLAALVVSIIIMGDAWLGWKHDMRVLLECPMEASQLERVRHIVGADPQVLSTSFVRSRRVGKGVVVDVGIVVERAETVGHACRVGARIRSRLLQEVQWLQEANVFPFAGGEAPAAQGGGPSA